MDYTIPGETINFTPEQFDQIGPSLKQQGYSGEQIEAVYRSIPLTKAKLKWHLSRCSRETLENGLFNSLKSQCVDEQFEYLKDEPKRNPTRGTS